jgi:hypothetical protein
MNPLRRRLSYANVAATLAVVFAMTGGALAADHYLITSTGQIKPSILKKLRGAKGATGLTGAQGAIGARGPVGAQGPAGAQGQTGPSGSSASGYAASGESVNELPSSFTTLVSKQVAPGSYVVSAKTWIVASSKTPVRAGALCFLFDSPIGHAVGEGTPIDSGSWAGVPGELEPGHLEAAATLGLQGTATTTTARELNLICRDTSNAGASIHVASSKLSAIDAGELH